MGLEFKVHDVMGEESYVDRNGKSIPNIVEGMSRYPLNRLDDMFLGVLIERGTIDQGIRGELLECYEPVNRILVEAPRVAYKDANPDNFLISESRGIVAIDFERLRLMPPQMELINLLEWYGEELGAKERGRLIEYYIKGFEGVFGRDFDRDYFMGLYFACGVDRHLYLVGYREKEKKADEQRFHLRFAHEHVGKLRTHSLVRAEEREKLKTLEGLLEKIKV